MTRDPLPDSRAVIPEDAAPLHLWLLVAAGISGVAATPGEASDAAHRAMDQHGDAPAMAVFEAHPVRDWPYVRLVPSGASSRAVHEWMAANIARAGQREAGRKNRKREKDEHGS